MDWNMEDIKEKGTVLPLGSDEVVAINLNFSISIPILEKYWQKRHWNSFIFFLICNTGSDDSLLRFCE